METRYTPSPNMVKVMAGQGTLVRPICSPCQGLNLLSVFKTGNQKKPEPNKQGPFAKYKVSPNMVKAMAGQGTLVRPPHLQFPSPTQSSDRRIRPFMLFTAVDSR